MKYWRGRRNNDKFATVRSILALIGIAVLSACHTRDAIRQCPAWDDANFQLCMDTTANDGSFKTAMEKCLPPVEPIRYKGTWATDFEFNQFFVDQELSAADAWKSRGHETSLEVEGTPLERYTDDENAAVLYIEFRGRKAPCDIFGEDYDLVIVDQLVSKRIIEDRVSEWSGKPEDPPSTAAPHRP